MARKTSRVTVPSAADRRRLAVHAYVYLYPLVRMEVTRRRMTGCAPQGLTVSAPPNTFWHEDADADPRPGLVDGPVDPSVRLSAAWLDLTRGPVVLSCDGTHGRYHVLSMLDMWNEVFAAPGTRTTGNRHGAWAVVPPGWEGYLPPALRRVDAPTVHVWLRGRIQAGSAHGRAPLHQIQKALHLTTLARWMLPSFRQDARPEGRLHAVPAPRVPVESMTGEEFFRVALRLLGTHPVRAGHDALPARIARLGITPGAELEDLEPAVRASLASVPPTALHLMRSASPHRGGVGNGWRAHPRTGGSGGIGGDPHLTRAVAAMTDLGADLPEDAIGLTLDRDPAGGPLLGARGYVLRFDADQLPPADAFWSITVLDPSGAPWSSRLGPTGGRTDARAVETLPRCADGSVEVRLQYGEPGGPRREQWLPTPEGGFSVRLCLYSPRREALDGSWMPPPLRLGAARHLGSWDPCGAPPSGIRWRYGRERGAPPAAEVPPQFSPGGGR
ncbi:DUF1254 domain-containing protein [Oryzihumus sp.]